MEKIHDLPNLLAHAREYLKLGFSIIPVGYDKKPAINSWKYYQDKKPTLEEVETWFTVGTATGIGIITGKVSNLIVLDFEHNAVIPELPDTVVAKSGGGGKHFYFKYPPNVDVPNVIKLNGQPMDVKSTGGYVLAPPSLHKSGNHYEWEKGFKETELAEFPEYWIDIIEDKVGQSNNTDFTKIVDGVQEGNRNDSAAKVVGKIVRYLPQQDWAEFAWPLIEGWNLKNDPPLPIEELKSVFNSIAKAEQVSNKQEDAHFATEPILLSKFLEEPVQPVKWMVEHLIPAGGLTVLSGVPGSYKTWLMLYFALQVAKGHVVFSQFHTAKGNVLIIDEENNRDMIKDRLRILGADKDSMIYFWVKGEFKADNKAHMTKLLEFTKTNDIKLICFDSLVRIHDKEENDAKQMAKLFASFNPLLRENISVILTHHHRKEALGQGKNTSQSMRGSSDILAALDCHLVVDRKTDEKYLNIYQRKLRVAEEHKPFQVKILEEAGKTIFKYFGELAEFELKKDKAKILILELLEKQSFLRTEIIEILKKEMGESAIGLGLRALVAENKVTETKGAKGKITYSLITQKKLGDDEDYLDD